MSSITSVTVRRRFCSARPASVRRCVRKCCWQPRTVTIRPVNRRMNSICSRSGTWDGSWRSSWSAIGMRCIRCIYRTLSISYRRSCRGLQIRWVWKNWERVYSKKALNRKCFWVKSVSDSGLFSVHGRFTLRFHIPELRKYYVKGTKNVGKCTKLGQILLKICSLFSWSML